MMQPQLVVDEDDDFDGEVEPDNPLVGFAI
jgi:hypothetical protein